MPYCSKCGSEIKEGSSYCSKCGQKINLKEELTDSGQAKKSDGKKSSTKIVVAIVLAVVIIFAGLSAAGVWGYYKYKKWILEQSNKSLEEQGEKESDQEDQDLNEALHSVADLTPYEGSLETSYYNESTGTNASYTGPNGVVPGLILDWYKEQIEENKDGWTLVRETSDQEVLYLDENGKYFQVWMYEVNLVDGVSYVVEYPPLNPNQ